MIKTILQTPFKIMLFSFLFLLLLVWLVIEPIKAIILFFYSFLSSNRNKLKG